MHSSNRPIDPKWSIDRWHLYSNRTRSIHLCPCSSSIRTLSVHDFLCRRFSECGHTVSAMKPAPMQTNKCCSGHLRCAILCRLKRKGEKRKMSSQIWYVVRQLIVFTCTHLSIPSTANRYRRGKSHIWIRRRLWNCHKRLWFSIDSRTTSTFVAENTRITLCAVPFCVAAPRCAHSRPHNPWAWVWVALWKWYYVRRHQAMGQHAIAAFSSHCVPWAMCIWWLNPLDPTTNRPTQSPAKSRIRKIGWCLFAMFNCIVCAQPLFLHISPKCWIVLCWPPLGTQQYSHGNRTNAETCLPHALRRSLSVSRIRRAENDRNQQLTMTKRP